MATFEQVAASTNGERELSINRLTDIDGIARKTAEAMYEIGIHGYADLARYLSGRTAQRISEALKEHGVNRPPAFIDQETWARQAREFGDLGNTVPTPTEDIATHAGMTGGQTPSETEAAVPPVPVKLCDARLEIGDVQLSVLGSTSDVPEKRLQAEVSFQLSGADAEALASKGIPFRIEGYTVEVESGVSELVASDRSQLTRKVFEYRRRQEFGIPDVGRYQFHSVVLLLPPGEIAAFHQGPTLNVVP